MTGRRAPTREIAAATTATPPRKAAANAQIPHYHHQRQKVAEEHLSKPTDALTKVNVLEDGDNSGGIHRDSDGIKLIFKSSSVKVSVVKKSGAQVLTPAENQNTEPETVTSSGLQSLCQLYRSDEED